MFIVQYRKFFYALSIAIVAFSLFSIFYKGLPLGIQFTGGSLLEVSYVTEGGNQNEASALDATSTDNQSATLTTDSSSGTSSEATTTAGVTDSSAPRPSVGDVRSALPSQFQDAVIQPTGQDGFILRTKELGEEDRQILLDALSLGGTRNVEEEQFSFIGPTIGQELRTRAGYAIGVVVLGIIFFIAYSFRRVSEPVSSWKYGFIAILALFHDVIIPTGIFAFLGLVLGYQIDVLFVIALLTILGYSVNDTIVVFDRVRENLEKNQEKEKENPEVYTPEPFWDVVGRSLSQTFTRSINTSVTTLLVVLVLYFVGSDSTQNFALVLAIGIFAGTYSSLFIATPLLVTVQKYQEKHPPKVRVEDTEEENKESA